MRVATVEFEAWAAVGTPLPWRVERSVQKYAVFDLAPYVACSCSGFMLIICLEDFISFSCVSWRSA